MWKFWLWGRKKKADVPNTNASAVEAAYDNVQKERELKRQRNEARTRFKLLWWVVWMDFAGSTTLHGPIHLSTTEGKTRWYYSFVVLVCTIMFYIHTAHLVNGYFAHPILTAIKYDNVNFEYPDITICPNSPFTDTQLYENEETAKNIKHSYSLAKELWWRSPKYLDMSPNARIKRSLLRQFYQHSDKLGKVVYDHVIFCEVSDLTIILFSENWASVE